MRKRWKVVVAIVGALVLGSWFLLREHAYDPYPFLAGRQPIDVSVEPPGTWSPREARTYTWKQPWREVAAAARQDLPAFNLFERRRNKKQGPGATWMSKETYGNGLEGISADIVVAIVPGRSREVRGHDSDIDKNPEWVTVAVVTVLDDNWINILRYTFFGDRN